METQGFHSLLWPIVHSGLENMNIFKGTESWDDEKFDKVSGLRTHEFISENLGNKPWATRREKNLC